MSQCPVSISMDVHAALARAVSANVIAIDTETTGLDPRKNRLVGISLYVPGDTVGYYLPVYSAVDGPNQLVSLDAALSVVRAVLCNPAKTAIFHNATFDLRVFRELGIRSNCRLFDTMLAAHRLDNTYWSITADQPLNYKLKTLTHYLLGVAQQTFAQVTNGNPSHMVRASVMAPYAVADAYYTAQLYLHFQQNLDMQTGVRRVLEEFDFPIQQVLVEMLHRGMPVAPEVAESEIIAARAEFTARNQEIAALIGKPGLTVSGKWLRHILIHHFDALRWPQQSLSKKALKKLGRENRNPILKRFIDLVLVRRQHATLISSFFVPLQKRIVPALQRLFVGNIGQMTASGRFTSHSPNVLALPKKGPVRRIIVAPHGSRIVAMDFRNIEPRCITQAILLLIQQQDMPVRLAKAENRTRKNALLEDLPPRVFTREYQPPVEVPFPATALADYLIRGGNDPYSFAAQRMFNVKKVSSAQREKAKKLFLTTSYGQGLVGIAQELGLDPFDCSTGSTAIDQSIELLNRFGEAIPELGVPRFTKVDGRWRRVATNMVTLRDQVQQMIRLTGEVESLFGGKRRFAGLWHFSRHDRLLLTYHVGGGQYEFDVTPIQRWNFVLHCYVHQVRDLRTGLVLASAQNPMPNHRLFQRQGLTAWPYRQLSYKYIRTVTTLTGEQIANTTLDDAYRQGFNSKFQMTAGEIFKRAMLAVDPITQQFGAVQMILNLHDELVFVVPGRRLHAFVKLAKQAMTQKPAPWWEIPLDVEVKVGQDYGSMEPYFRWWWQWLSWKIAQFCKRLGTSVVRRANPLTWFKTTFSRVCAGFAKLTRACGGWWRSPP